MLLQWVRVSSGIQSILKGLCIQGSSKRCTLGCVNLPPAARGSQEVGFTQLRAYLLADPCEYVLSVPVYLGSWRAAWRRRPSPSSRFANFHRCRASWRGRRGSSCLNKGCSTIVPRNKEISLLRLFCRVILKDSTVICSRGAGKRSHATRKSQMVDVIFPLSELCCLCVVPLWGIKELALPSMKIKSAAR